MKLLSNWACGGLAVLALAGAVPAASQAAAASAAHPNFDGVWLVERRYNVQAGTSPDDGSPIPLLEWTKALQEASVKSAVAGLPWSANNQRCLVAGTLRAFKGNFPFEMVQTDKELSLLFEEDGRVNQMPFRDKHKKHLQPSWYGDPIAHWEGDTAVVDTIGFNEKTPFIASIWHTSQLHTVMRFHLINGGKNLEVRTTIDDPGAFSKVFENLVVFDHMPAGYKICDYRCAENNQDLPTTGMFGPD